MTAVQASQHKATQSLRYAARRFATGVTVVAIADGDRMHAMTANSFVTLSLDPPLVGVAAMAGGRMSSLTERVRSFGISVLNDAQYDYAKHYARRDRTGISPDLAFVRADHRSGVPVVPGCVAYFVCELRSVQPVGDHDLFIGSVLKCDACWPGRAPLVFLDGEFQSADVLVTGLRR